MCAAQVPVCLEGNLLPEARLGGCTNDSRHSTAEVVRASPPADQGVEEHSVQGCDDRRCRRCPDLFNGEGDEPVSGTHERGPERGITSGHKEQLVAGQRQGSAGPEPVLQRSGDVGIGLPGVALGETVEQGSDQARPITEVVANRTMGEPGAVFYRTKGEAGCARAAEKFKGGVQEPYARVLLHMEKNRRYALLHVENRVAA